MGCFNSKQADNVEPRKEGGKQEGQKHADPDTRHFDVFREEADKYAKERGDYFEKSKRAFESGDKAEAKRLSDLGKEAGKKMEAANEKAVRAILDPQDLKSGTIDLHGLQVKEALEAVEDFLKMHRGKSEVTIITGAGNHSENNFSKVKHETHKLISGKGLQFSEINHGSILVTL